MRNSVKYVIFFTLAIAIVNVWFIAIGADSNFQGVYTALAAVLSAVVIEGRKQNGRK
jgi:hypothetical protein